MSSTEKTLRFVWWNLQSFSHFEAARASDQQWPREPAAYAGKCQRVDAAMLQLFANKPPEVLGFAEITNRAAQEVRDRLFPDHEVLSLDLNPKPELQVAILYNKTSGTFQEDVPVVVPYTPRGTRPMAVIDHVSRGNRIRFVACHWTARFSDQTEQTRQQIADHLNREIYGFIQHSPPGETRHVVVLGDLNTEPYGLLEKSMHASRDRGRSWIKHYTDPDTQKVRLYNCSWRFLGERVPHFGGSPTGHTAGTLYWKAKNTWHTFDHVLVSATLLTQSVPFLDELSLQVVTCPFLLEPDGRPLKYDWRNGNPIGVSDHLPISGQIILERENGYA